MPSQEVYVEVLAETANEILVDDGDQQVWIPKSEIESESEVWGEGDEGLLVIPEWLADDRGLC